MPHTQDELKQMADEVRAAAKVYLSRNRKYMTDESISLKNMLLMDGTRLEILADLIQDGKMASAWTYAQSFETVPREEIPARVWVALGGKLTKG